MRAVTRRVGVLGLGNMGAAMARRLLGAGFEVWVSNRSSERAAPLVAAGAVWAQDGAALGAEVDLLISMVADDAALTAVTDGPASVLARARDGLVYADMSSVSPAASAGVARRAAAAGVPYLRAPVSGSTVLAEAGSLRVMVSGPADAFAGAEDVFSALGQRTFHLGHGEEARVMKLILNTLVATTVVGLTEALAFGQRAGMGWEAMLDVFSDSAVASPLVKYKAASLADRDFTAAFSTAMMAKDLAVALQLAHDSGTALPTTAHSHELLRAACAKGWGELDFTSLLLLFEDFGPHAGGTAGPEPRLSGVPS